MNAATAAGDPPASSLEQAVARTRAWVEGAVIGLNLCPFAKAAHARQRARYVGCDATEPAALLDAFVAEVHQLRDTSVEALETTLLVHPFVLTDFARYNDFLDVADAALAAEGMHGVLQVASFHPNYRFAGTAADDITNATNRSPHPLLQLLREESVERALAAFPDPAAIYETNLVTLRRLGPEGWRGLASTWTPPARLADAGARIKGATKKATGPTPKRAR